MPFHLFEHATDAAAPAGEVLAALRARGSSAAADAHSGEALADRTDRLLKSLAEHGVRPGEPVHVAAAEAVETVLGCLAVWLSGGVPGVGPATADGATRLVVDVAAGAALAAAGHEPGGRDEEPVRVDAALLVSAELTGCVAHPTGSLGRLRLPAERPASLLVLADWRVDAWLPLVLEAWLDGTERISLRSDGFWDAGPLPDGPAVLAGPASRPTADAAPAAAGTFTHRITWGAGPAPADGTVTHGFGDHHVLAVTRAHPADGGSAHRGEVPGRHRVCNPAGRPLPTNAWGLLALAGRLPFVADGLGELLAAVAAEPGERTLLTGYRARKRSDGTVEFDTRREDALRFAGRLLSPAAVTRVLAGAGLADAALVARDTGTGRARLVLCAPGDGPGRVALERLAALLPAWAAPLSACRVPTLPRDAEGRVDTARLAADAPPDDLQLERAALALATDGAPVRLRTVPVATRDEELPLPEDFMAGGGHYPATRPAEARGPELAPPADDLVDRLRKAAATDRGIPLVDGEGREHRLSYAELLDQVSRVATHLRARGLGHGDELIVHASAAGDIFVGVWACVLLGVLPVPLTPATPYDAAGNPLWHLLGPDTMLTGRTVLTTEAQKDVMAGVLERRGLTAQVLTLEEARRHEPLPAGEAAPRSPALMILTSGSTGAPKGVALSHRNLVSLAESVRNEFDLADEVSLNWLGVDHVGGLVQHHVRDLCLANEQVHVDTGWVLADPTRMLDLMDRHRVTLSWMANFGFTLVNEQAAKIAEGSWDLSRLKVWENGGEPVTHEGNQRFLALLAPHGLRPDVIKPVFGMTETSSAVIGAHNLVAGSQAYVHWLNDATLDRPVRRALPGEGSPFAEVGTPMAGLALRVVDADGRVCPEGVGGRIEVSGLQVMDGYYRNPDADAEAFTEDGWLRMGDCGFMVDGSLVVTGREKDVLIINGLNYAARALENAVEAVAGVRQGCCAAVPVRRPDASTDDLVVFYSSTAPGAADPAAVEAALVSEHSLRPVALVEIGPEEWPRTAIGKIRRPVLAQGFQAGDFADRITLRRAHGLGDRATVPAWHFVPDWRPVAAPDPDPACRVLWIGGRAPAGAALSAEPGAPFAGFDAAGGARFRTDRAEDLHALFEAAAERLDGLDAVVDTRWNTAPAEAAAGTGAEAPAETAARALREAHAAWAALLPAAARLAEPPALVLATRAAVVATGAEPDVTHAALAGVAESLALSHPRLRVALVDGATDDALLAECSLRGTGQTAHRDGVRLARGLRPLDEPVIPARPRRVLREQGAYLVVGGLGGVGAHLTQHLLRRFDARVVVVGRGAAGPDDARGALLAHLADRTGPGGELRHARLDATDADALRAAIDAAEADWGPLDGVFQLAGEGSVSEQLEVLAAPDEDSARRLHARAEARIRMSHALDEALQGRDTPLVVFSSVNGFFGGAGFTEYAGACAYQAAHAAHSAHRTGRTRLCLDWSMWKQVGMASGTPAGVQELAQRRGFASLTPAQGLASLHTALESAEDRLLIGLSAAGEAVAGLLPFGTVGYELEADAEDPARVAAEVGIDPALVRRTRSTASRGPVATVAAEHVEALLAVFHDVLGTAEIGPEDNFFAAGGDSIRAIQAVARAAERGFRFSPLDLFEHKTAAELCVHLAGRDGLAGLGTDADDDAEPVERAAVPPVFGWWLEKADRREVRDHLTMSMRYHVAAAVGPDTVEAALGALVERHDALRMRLAHTAEGWRLLAGDSVPDSLRFEVHDLAPGEEAAAAADAAEPGLHRRVGAEDGPLVRAALLRPAGGADAVLVLVIHHAAVDGVSWRIIEDDLRLLLDAGARGAEPGLPAPTVGFLPWARRMEHRAERLEPERADDWADRLAGGWGSLPGTPTGPLLDRDTEILTRRIPAGLLDGIGENSVNEVLLTAVGWALARWAGAEALALDVEGHGRLDAQAPVDLTRTVGWFTAIAPLRLDLRDCAVPAAAVPRVRQALASLRGRDQEWGLLRYGGACPPGHPLLALPERQVSYNYLGFFDGAGPEPDPLFAALPGSLGAEQSPEAERHYLIDVAAVVAGGELELAVKFSPEVHSAQEAGALLDGCAEALRGLLADGGPTPGTADVDHAELLLALEEVSLGEDDD
ncbi:SDR family NAD(P)-dependent oxidoreductase [Streptomyces sp. ALB3]|uniref:SDR family NAD(P)-dependent oxidoreductase n=1 Tax=Streptomyces sp. ALB3 TaxID=3374278 RepID=UPI0037B2DA8B